MTLPARIFAACAATFFTFSACAVAATTQVQKAAARAQPATTPPSAKSKPDSRSEARARRQVLSNVKTWGIQLRFLDRAAITRSPYDLIVMDHAPHPQKDVEIPFPQTDIAALKKKPDGGRRLILAYLSIGEAERYRYYWRESWDDSISRPAWLLAQNPNWPGNYFVKYADPDWQAVIFGTPASYLDRIIAAGFDGVYLDRADAFQDEGQPQPESEEAMLRFVTRICDHARRTDPKFLVILQNAEELLRHQNLMVRLDGIAKEDLSYGADNTAKANPPGMVADSLSYLRKARRSGMSVLTLEYVKDKESASIVRKLADQEGFRLFLAERLLDSLDTGTQAPEAANPAGSPQP